MTDITKPDQPKRPRLLRAFLLVLTLLTSPLICCGGIQLLDALPASVLPAGMDFVLNLFESEARVENRTSETYTITAITTTYGKPTVIPQNIAFRQRDIPLAPNESIALKYDAADSPLAGIVVCKTKNDCRLLSFANSDVYVLESYESLPELDSGWLTAIQASALHNYSNIVMPTLSLLPVLLYLGWLYLVRLEKKHAE